MKIGYQVISNIVVGPKGRLFSRKFDSHISSLVSEHYSAVSLYIVYSCCSDEKAFALPVFTVGRRCLRMLSDLDMLSNPNCAAQRTQSRRLQFPRDWLWDGICFVRYPTSVPKAAPIGE